MKAQSSKNKNSYSSLKSLRKLVEDDFNLVDKLAYELISSKASLIPDISHHTISSGGKRMRPMLTLASAKICGYEGTCHIDLAACVEFIHTATLLHDDVVDKSDMRRGASTANNVWGNKESILVGDFLLGKAFYLMGAAGSLEVYKILSNAAVVISEGEVMQLSDVANLTDSDDNYIEIISAKTAELFAAACEVGAVIANRPTAEVQALRSFGLNLGRAFQIVDDALDYHLDNDSMGKNSGDDFSEQKITLPVIISYRDGSSEERQFWERTIGAGKQEKTDFALACEIIKSQGTLEKVMSRAKDFVNPAKKAMSIFPESETLEHMLGVLDFSVNRKF